MRIRVVIEVTAKKVFVSALDWPGLSRGGRDEGVAMESLIAAVPRYATVAREAGVPFDAGDARVEIEVVERLEGNASTEFGVPAMIADADRTPTREAEAARLASLVEAAWTVFDRTAASAPEALRKGPRGGGRDRSKIVDHVNGADAAYAGQIGIKAGPGHDVSTLRAAVLSVLRAASDGGALGGRRWTQRYAARRIAWHAIDHAWEIEDRSPSA